MLRRFVPLLAVLALSLTFLLARLWDIQIVQHETWSTEAVNLVRSYSVKPYVRGALRDRHGKLITRDEEVYALEFVWRDFRRGHPLGQVAMMRSLMLMRPVGLDEARPTLGEAALAYASLTPRALEDFATGGALDAGIDYVPAIAAANDEKRREEAVLQRRRPRAGDLRYYILRMLRLSPRQVKDLMEAVEDGGEALSFLELSANLREETLLSAQAALRADVVNADANLSRLAPLIDWSDASDGADDDFGAVIAAGDRLVPLIEERRREVDDDTADALFRVAAGFSSMRVSEETLARFDLRWLRAALDWDEQRLKEWQERRGGAFRDAIDSWMAGTTIARSKIGDESMWAGDRVLSAFAHAFRTDADAWGRENAAAEDWRLVDEFEVLAALPERLAAGEKLPKDLLRAPVFRFQTEALRRAPLEGAGLVEAAFEGALQRVASGELAVGPAVTGPLVTGPLGLPQRPRLSRDTAELAAMAVRVAERSAPEWQPEDERLFGALLESGYDQVQARVSELLDAAFGATPEEERVFGLAFDEPFVEKALETRRYAIRDRGARTRVVGGEPSTDLVLLVTRYSEDFAGFTVASKTRRVPIALGPDGTTLIASKLIGAVRSPFLVEVMKRAPDREELSALKRKHRLPAEDETRILSLLDAAFLADEAVGGSGLEAWFDDELSGTPGYREVQGLQDRVAGNRKAIHRPKVDGEDVRLTLDLGLQWAAEDVLLHPEPPPASDRDADDLWFERPVGAIVLATVGGEILAAASVPVVSGLEVGPPVTDGERAHAIDRTLVRPRGQAPGSVVKPLLAAYALQHLELNPKIGLEYCDVDRPRPGTSPKKATVAGFGVVNCNSRFGHSRRVGDRKLDLMQSLMFSCNVYFAALGERYFTPETMRAAYTAFGFGQPTGVKYDDTGDRGGIVDSYWQSSDSPLHESAPKGEPGLVKRQFLGNGLVYVDSSVVQMVRAYAGLATGFLPRMTLVSKIGDRDVQRQEAAIDIDEKHLNFVRRALVGVVNTNGGTAFGKGLSEGDLGFRFAAKTGSADYGDGLVPPRNGRGTPLDAYIEGVRKHTWVAGWFPAEDPKYVVVVYLHDTSATAGHSAVYVAGQFLSRPEVLSLVQGGEANAPLPGADSSAGASSDSAAGQGTPR